MAELVRKLSEVAPTGALDLNACLSECLPQRDRPSLVVVVLCGFAIAWLTGGYRLPGRRARIAVLALSVAGPMLPPCFCRSMP